MPREDERRDPFYFLRLGARREADDLYSAAFDLVRGLRPIAPPASLPPADAAPVRRGSHAEHAAQFPELAD